MGKINIKVPLKGKMRIKRILEFYNVSWNWKLQPKTIIVASDLYNQYFKLKEDNKDFDAVMNKIFSKKNKDDMINRLATSEHSLANMLTEFRRVGLIKDNKLVTHYIPSSIADNEFIFQLTFNNGN